MLFAASIPAIRAGIFDKTSMKVKKIVELKTQYSFEAPLFPAAVTKKDRNGNGQPKEELLDLNETLAPKPENIFIVRVNGESMIEEHIYDGDVLIVERETKPKDGQVVIAALNGEMAVKKYRVKDGKVYLFSANKSFLPIEIKPFWEFQIQGIVRHVIHNV